MNRRLLTLAATLAAAASLLGASAVGAADFPSRPIRMLVGFPAGGGADLVARLMAAEMQKTFGQTVVVDNRAGAAGNIATDALFRSAPDGYTVLMGNTGALAINPSLYTRLAFSTSTDIEPVVLVATSPLVVMVNPAQTFKTLGELVAAGRAHTGTLNYGTGGAGSISHLAFEQLKSQTGADFVHVPYRGGAPAVSDLLGNQLQVVVDGVPLAAPFVTGSKIRALAVTSARRSSVLPEVPTAAEAGYPGFDAIAWYGVMVPAHTPAPVIARLNAAVNQALKNPEVREKLAAQGSDPAGGTPAEFGAFLKQEVARWATIVKASGAKAD